MCCTLLLCFLHGINLSCESGLHGARCCREEKEVLTSLEILMSRSCLPSSSHCRALCEELLLLQSHVSKGALVHPGTNVTRCHVPYLLFYE